MKKRIIALTTAIIMITSVSFAKDIRPVPESVVTSFEHEFEEANNINWIATNDFYKALFTVNEFLMEAFYSLDGELIAVSKKITIDQLPISLLKKAKEKIGSYHVSSIFELSTDRGIEYFISVENGNDKKVFKNSGYTWIRY